MGIIFCRYPTDFSYINRGVARGGGQGVRALPEFGRSVNPIQTRGQIMPLTSHPTASPPPRIQKAI